MLDIVGIYYTAILIKKTLGNSVFFRMRWKYIYGALKQFFMNLFRMLFVITGE